jgi:hypothetical protein
MVPPGVTLHCNQHWHRNIGHALFDRLYPAYLALIRFSSKHLETFRIFAGLDNPHCDICFREDIYACFACLELLTSNSIDQIMPCRCLVFEELIVVVGMMCQRCIQSNYQLSDGLTLDGSRLFRDGMCKQHGLLQPDVRRNHAA